jgi:hypothetical protein
VKLSGRLNSFIESIKARPLVLPEGDHSGWFDYKWISGTEYVVLSGNYSDGLIFWTGQVDQEPRIIDTNVNSFDAIWVP